MHRFWLILGLSMAVAHGGSSQEPVTAFVNVTVIPMDRAGRLESQTVIVRGTRIVEIGPFGRVEIPAGARRVQSGGAPRYLVPGLGDMHYHLTYRRDRDDTVAIAKKRLLLALASGVTSIRDPAALPLLPRLRGEILRGELLGPRVYGAAGPQFDTDSLITDPQQAKQIVTKSKAAGFDMIKLHSWSMTPTAFDTLVASAREARMPLIGHAPMQVPGGITVEQWIAAKPMSTEHLSELLDMFHEPDFAERLASRAKLLARAGAWSCPTLTLGHIAEAQTPETAPYRQKVYQSIQALHKAGVGLVAGTDMVGEASAHLAEVTPRDAALTRELELFTRAGLTPHQALETATVNVARFLGTQDSLGTVTVGKVADLVLFDEDPFLLNMQTMRYPVGVMIGGRWITREEFHALLLRDFGPPRDWRAWDADAVNE